MEYNVMEETISKLIKGAEILIPICFVLAGVIFAGSLIMKRQKNLKEAKKNGEKPKAVFTLRTLRQFSILLILVSMSLRMNYLLDGFDVSFKSLLIPCIPLFIWAMVCIIRTFFSRLDD
ncbi:ABC-type transport system involved in Fe-S cluster assembly fused permease/ATPase subunit [Lachnospiraceae bacterium PM6-15]|uniref:hypothetical protein n=1 Tax=Ohessyouella blattaphilus TaxID=2949333 RepID=UPI003E1FBF0E